MRIVRQAGAIAVRGNGPRAEVFVVRAKKNPADWIFPKGHIEPGEEAPTAAVRELLEEGGVIGEVADLVGISSFTTGEKIVEVSYYLVRYTADGTAAEYREKRWLPFGVAREVLTFEDARRYVDTVAGLIGSLPSS
jgi:8-oxo-dGTP pyrophosphatase MutT (NUDIX family)